MAQEPEQVVAIPGEESSLLGVAAEEDNGLPSEYDLSDPEKRSFLIICVGVFIVIGMNNAIPMVAMSYFAKDTLKASPAELTALFSANGLAQIIPYCIKPVYGILTDILPIGGYRRKPYILLGLIGMSICFCWMAACDTVPSMVASLFTLNVCFASTQLIAEALLVDYTNEKNLNEKDASKLQGVAWRWYFIAGAVGSILGAILIEFCSYRTIFVISAVPSILLFIMCLYAGNVEQPSQITASRASEVVTEYSKSLGATFCNKMLLLIVLYNVLFYVSPTLGYTNSGMGFYYYSNAMHINKGVLAYLPVLWNFLTAAGMWLYEKYFCDHYTIHQQLMMMLPAMALVQLAGAPLYASGADMPLGLGITYIIVYNAFVAGLQGALSLPTFAMCSMVCPPQIAATMYAILTSIQNQALMVATQTTVGFQEAFGITKTNFDSLWIMCIVFAVVQIVPYVSLVWPDSLGGSLVPKDLDAAVAEFHEEFDSKYSVEGKALPVTAK